MEHCRASLKHEATTLSQLKVEQLERQIEVLSLFVAQLRSAIDFTDRAITDGDNVNLLSIKTQLNQLNSSENQLKPCRDDYLRLKVHQTVCNFGNMASFHFIPPDLQKCIVGVVGGEEGVMYETFASQSVDFMLIVKDEKGMKEAEGGHQVEARATFSSEAIHNENQETLQLLVQDSGDGSYCFSYHSRPGGVGVVTLSITVDGQSIGGSPFNWRVNPPLGPLQQNAIGIRRGMKCCWKLQLVNSFIATASELQIGVMNWNQRSSFTLPVKWFWHYKAANQVKDCLRSDHQKTSITSVQDNDVFTVFLNLNTKKLIIYNVRSKQAEIFTKVAGDHLFPIIVPFHIVKFYS